MQKNHTSLLFLNLFFPLLPLKTGLAMLFSLDSNVQSSYLSLQWDVSLKSACVCVYVYTHTVYLYKICM